MQPICTDDEIQRSIDAEEEVVTTTVSQVVDERETIEEESKVGTVLA